MDFPPLKKCGILRRFEFLNWPEELVHGCAKRIRIEKNDGWKVIMWVGPCMREKLPP